MSWCVSRLRGAGFGYFRRINTTAGIVALGAAPRRDELILLTAALGWAAGFVHALASVDHFDHYWLYGAFFAVLAGAQFSWGVALYRRPARRLLVAGAMFSIGIVFLWAFTRIIGPPIGPGAWAPEPVGVPDLAATLTQGLTAAIALLLVRKEPAPYVSGRGAAVARACAYPLLIAALLAAFMGGHGH